MSTAPAARVRVRIVVTGIVQGVWFRDSCREQARAVHVGGYVRNRPDGAVEAEAVGGEARLRQFVEALRAGPRFARVEATAAQWFESADAPRGFRVTG